MLLPRLSRGAFARLGFLAIALAGIVAFAAPSRADPSPAAKCEMPYDEAVSYGRRGVAADNAAVFTDYSGEEASKLLIGINSFPPVSDWTADHILVFDAPDEAIVVGLVDKGCVTKAFKVPRDDWATLRSEAIGDRT
jgi:hypothetical protein